MAQESVPDDMFVDEFYFSVLADEQENVIFPVSDEKYAEGLQLQEVLMGALVTSQMANNHRVVSFASSSLTVQVSFPATDPEPEAAKKEAGESSYSFCDICAERKDSDQMFRNENCVHSFCSECIGKHIATKIQEGIINVSCPGLECRVVLEIDACRSMLPNDVLERWDEALCMALIASEATLYCPFKDCSVMLVDANRAPASLVKEEEENIRESECPSCHRFFCAQCYVPWHPGIECEEFQKLNENERGRDDLMLRELASEKKWKRCPNCKFYVERTEGCLHMTCRCGIQFCYACGSSWTSTHACSQGG